MSAITIERIDYNDPVACENLVGLLDDYARDVMGGGEALPAKTKSELCSKLAGFPGAISLLASVESEPVGFSNCFPGFSTFACAPLLNIHDIAVAPAWRGRGIALKLMDEVLSVAKERGCCKITLEVLAGNEVAKSLYMKKGFEPAGLDPDLGSYEFWQKSIF